MCSSDLNLTGALYGGDSYYRLCQEVLLGIGGVRILRDLGYNDLTRYHMNEGHAALLALELLGEEAAKAGRTSIRGEDIEKVRSKCVFTTHTPVPAGHDRFPMEYLTRVFPKQTEFFDLTDASSANLVKRILQAEQSIPGLQEAARLGTSVNMTQLALSLSRYVTELPSSTARLHAKCFRKCPSRLSRTAFTPARGPRPRSSSCSTDTFPHGVKTTIVCVARSACPRKKFGPRT